MTNTTETFWDVNGISLQTMAFNISSLGGDRKSVPPVRGSNVLIPHHAGKEWVPKEVDERTQTLAMWVVGQNEDGTVDAEGKILFDRNLKKLQRLLWRPKEQLTITKRFWILATELTDAGISLVGLPVDDSGDYVLIEAVGEGEYVGGLTPDMHGQTMGRFTVDLKFADPFYYGAEVQVNFDAVAPALTAQKWSQPANPTPQLTLDGYAINDPNSAYSGSSLDRVLGAGVDPVTLLADPAKYGAVVTVGSQVGTDDDALLVGVAYGSSSSSTDLPVTALKRYTFSQHVKGPFTNTLGLRIRFYNVSNVFLAMVETGYAPCVGGVFKRLIAPNILVPAGATHARVSYRIAPTGKPWRSGLTNLMPMYYTPALAGTFPRFTYEGIPALISQTSAGISFSDSIIPPKDTAILPAPLSGAHLFRAYAHVPAATTLDVALGSPYSAGIGAGVIPQTNYVASCFLSSSKAPTSGFRIRLDWGGSLGAFISSSLSPWISLSKLGTVNPGLWATRGVIGTTDDWLDIAYGNGKFVAVRSAGASRVASSVDGITWTLATIAAAIERVTFAFGLFIAVGTGVAYWSADGVTWTAGTGTIGGNRIAYDDFNGVLVTVTAGGTTTYKSTDGKVWAAGAAVTGATGITDITFGVMYATATWLFIVVCNTGTNRVYSSPDDVTWTARTAATANPWTGVKFGNGVYVAIAASGTNRIMTSVNGTAWTARAFTPTGITTLDFGNGIFIMADATSFYTSYDGITWTTTTPTGGLTPPVTSQIAWGNGRWIAVGTGGNMASQLITYTFNWQRLNYSVISPDGAYYASVYLEAIDGTIFNTGDWFAIGAPMLTQGYKLEKWFYGDTVDGTDGADYSYIVNPAIPYGGNAQGVASVRTGDKLYLDKVAVTEGATIEPYYDGDTAWVDPDRDYDWEAARLASRSVLKLPSLVDAGVEHDFVVLGDAPTTKIAMIHKGVQWAPRFSNITDANNEIYVKYANKILSGDLATVDVQGASATKRVSGVTTDDSGPLTHGGADDLFTIEPGTAKIKLKVDAGNGRSEFHYLPAYF